MAGVTFSQASMEAPGREAGFALISTGGIRLGRARRQWSRNHPFPVSSTAPHYRRTKSESQGLSRAHIGPVSDSPTQSEVGPQRHADLPEVRQSYRIFLTKQGALRRKGKTLQRADLPQSCFGINMSFAGIEESWQS